MKTPYIIIILGLLISFDQAFAINQSKEFEEGRWDFEASGNFFRSSSNYSTSGANRNLTDKNYYQLLDIPFTARWGVTDQMNLYFTGNMASAESKGVDATRTNSSLSKVMVGGELLLDMGSFQLIPEVSYTQNMEKVSNTQDSVLNSEGANEFTGKMNLQMDFDSFLMYGYGGFTYRDNGRSSLFPWGVNAEYSMDAFTLGAEVFGFRSVTDDKDTGQPNEAVRDLLRARTSAGSDRFTSLNPDIIDSNIYMKFALSPSISLWGAGGMTLAGSNYANGFHLEAGLRYTIGGDSRSVRKKVYEPAYESGPTSRDKKVDRFEEDTNDGVDQKMFRPNPTPVPKPKPKPAKKSSSTNLQNKMDDVEMEIELKSEKKKRK